MSHLSIRQIPPELDKAIQKEARRRNATKTAVVIDALREAFHLKSSSSRIQRNVRSFFGKMTSQEYQTFQKGVRDFSLVDDEMWK